MNYSLSQAHVWVFCHCWLSHTGAMQALQSAQYFFSSSTVRSCVRSLVSTICGSFFNLFPNVTQNPQLINNVLIMLNIHIISSWHVSLSIFFVIKQNKQEEENYIDRSCSSSSRTFCLFFFSTSFLTYLCFFFVLSIWIKEDDCVNEKMSKIQIWNIFLRNVVSLSCLWCQRVVVVEIHSY